MVYITLNRIWWDGCRWYHMLNGMSWAGGGGWYKTLNGMWWVGGGGCTVIMYMYILFASMHAHT